MVAIVKYNSHELKGVERAQHEGAECCEKLKSISTQPERTSVTFSEDVKTFEIPGRHTFTEEEIRDVYMSRFEQREVQRNILLSVREFLERSNDEDKLCDYSFHEKFRGLESLIIKDIERIKRMKKAISSILRRQTTGRIDEQWLSIAYRPFSEAAASAAYKRGLSDQEVAPFHVPRKSIMVR